MRRNSRSAAFLLAATVIATALTLVGHPAGAELPPGASTNGYGDIVGYTHPIVFPIPDGKVEVQSTFRASRGASRTHEGVDIIAPKMQPLVAVANGTISFITMTELSWGYAIRVKADDGWTYSYLHLNNDTPGTNDGRAQLSDIFAPGIALGVRVAAGQVIGYVGDSGYADGPHLHFEMRSPTSQLTDPGPSIRAALAVRGTGSVSVSGPVDTTSPAAPTTTVPEPPAPALEMLVSTPAPDPAAVPGRMAGLDRSETAVATSLSGWPSGSTEAVLVDGTSFGEALPASVLAARRGAPVLLASGGLTDPVRNELNRLGASRIWVIGSVPTTVDAELTANGRTVTRIGRAGDPATTAAQIARTIGTGDGTVVLVNQDSYADAIAASSLAAARGWPILLTRTTKIPQGTVDAWRAVQTTRTLVVGGSAVVGDNVLAFVPGGVRIAGTNRFETSAAAVNESLRLGARRDHVLVVTGGGFADAVSSGALAARLGVTTVLVDGSGSGADIYAQMLLAAMTGAQPHLLGGEAAIVPTAEARILQLLGR